MVVAMVVVMVAAEGMVDTMAEAMVDVMVDVMADAMVEAMAADGALTVGEVVGDGVGSHPDHLHMVKCVWGGEVGAKQEFGPPATALGFVSQGLLSARPRAAPGKGLKPSLPPGLGLLVISYPGRRLV